jgi:membrane fusion protein (multidrug efflux system)
MVNFKTKSLAVTTALSLFFAACSAPPVKEQPVPEVQVLEAVTRSIPVYAEYIGETYGQSDVEIIARVDGPITGIHFQEGQQVNAGQLLYTVDDPFVLNARQSAMAQLTAQEVMLVKTKADYDRVLPLAQMNALSMRDLDAAKAAYEAQKAAVSAAQAGLSNAEVQASYTRILAPISGVIGLSRVQVGDFVSRGAQALNVISATGDIRIRFSISETDYLKYREQASAKEDKTPIELEVMLSDGTVLPEKATFDFADRALDSGTGSLLVQAVIENTGGLLRPGQFVRVKTVSEQLSDVVIVPQQAVRQLQTLYQVMVVDENNMLTARTVKPGMRVGSNWVISEGLKAGEKVAMVGNAMIQPGKPIVPVPMQWSYDSTLTR